MHFGPFGCLTKLNAKWAELVQKFVSRSRVGIFRNERTWSTPLYSRLMFWCVAYYLGAFGNVWLPYKTRCKTGLSGAKVRAMKSCRNFSQQTTRSTPLRPNLMFHCVSYYFGAFGIVCCITTLIFWCVSYYLSAFVTVWLLYKNKCKTGWSGVKVRATKSRRNFSQRTH